MKDLTKNNIYKTFLSFAIPTILSGLLSQSYNIIDTAIAGRWLGDTGLGEIGGAASYITVLCSLFWGFCGGGGIRLGIIFGKKDYRRLKNTVITTFLITLGLALIICPLSILFKKEIFDFLEVNEALRDGGYKYFTLYVSGLIFIILNNFGVHIFSALGDSTYPLKLSFLSAILNITGNVLSVTVLGLGVLGIALSSVISAFIVDVAYVVKLRRVFRELGIHTCAYEFKKEDCVSVVRLSLPVCLQQMILYGATFLVAPFINNAGKSATAAYTVIGRVFEIATSLYQNATRVVTPFSSQCVGSKQFSLLKKGVKAGFLQALLFLVPTLALCSAFASPITNIFLEDGTSPEASGIAVNFIRFWMPFVVINMVNNLFHAFWRGIANMKFLLLGTFIGGLGQVIFTYLIAPSMGIHGVWLSWILCWSVEAILNFTLYKYGKWEKRLG